MDEAVYYHHTSLATLGQDDLMSILLYGAIGSTVLFMLPVAGITLYQSKQIGNNKGGNVFESITGALARSMFYSIFMLLIVNLVYIVLIKLSSDLTLNPAQAIEWFFHTNWTTDGTKLLGTLTKIKSEGEDALESAKIIVTYIVMLKIIFVLLFVSLHFLIFGIMTSKVHAMVSTSDTNGAEYVTTLMVSGLMGTITLSMIIFMLNSTFMSTFKMSDVFSDTTLYSDKVLMQKLYADLYDPSFIQATITGGNNEENDEIL